MCVYLCSSPGDEVQGERWKRWWRAKVLTHNFSLGRAFLHFQFLAYLCFTGGTPAQGPDHHEGVTRLGGVTHPVGAPPQTGGGVEAGVLAIELTAPTRAHQDTVAQEAGLPMATLLLMTNNEHTVWTEPIGITEGRSVPASMHNS